LQLEAAVVLRCNYETRSVSNFNTKGHYAAEILEQFFSERDISSIDKNLTVFLANFVLRMCRDCCSWGTEKNFPHRHFKRI